MERRSKMSAWNRHQTPSFKPANTAPYHGGNGGGSSGPQASVPDVSIRNHKRWKTVFERAIAEYVHRGHPGADELTALVRRAINRLLDKEPGAQTFKSFQVISDIIDALGTAVESNTLPGPIAFAKSEVTRAELASLTNLGSGRTFTRAVYNIFPVDHNGANNDTEFEVFLIRRNIRLWPIVVQAKLDGNHRRPQTSNRSLPPAGLTVSTKRQFEGQGASHYSPPAQRRRPPMPQQDTTCGEGTSSQPVSQRINYADEPELLIRPISTGMDLPQPPDFDAIAPFSMSRRPSSTALTIPATLPSDKETVVASPTPQQHKVAAGVDPSAALNAANMSVSATVAKATIDNESINEIIKQFTHDLTQRQKDIVALMTRVTELEASLGEREAEIAALKAGTDGEKMERFLKEKQALVRDQNKLALDRARLSAQASNWVEKLGQVQEGLCQYLPPQNTSLEKEADSEGT